MFFSEICKLIVLGAVHPASDALVHNSIEG